MAAGSQSYDCPGNIRELEKVLLEAFLFTQTTTIRPEDINIPICEEARAILLLFKSNEGDVIPNSLVPHRITWRAKHEGDKSNASRGKWDAIPYRSERDYLMVRHVGLKSLLGGHRDAVQQHQLRKPENDYLQPARHHQPGVGDLTV